MTAARIRHSTTGRWRLGLILAVCTMLAWATLPVALKVALVYLDPWTLTWFRFVAAAVVVSLWLSRGESGPILTIPQRGLWGLLLVAALGLIGNYILYLMGLELTAPAVAQVFIQLAPLLMGLGGIWLFGERYSRVQWTGFAVLLVGLGVFFRRQLAVFAAGAEPVWQGALLIFCAAVTWAAYALAQKQLLRDFSSARIMLFIYIFASLTLLPMAAPSALLQLSAMAWLVVAYCALNTLIAYGAFAEALDHWEASRVSAILALTPLGTIAFVALVERLRPGVLPPERLDWLSLSAAGLVVLGSIVVSIGLPSAARFRRAGK